MHSVRDHGNRRTLCYLESGAGVVLDAGVLLDSRHWRIRQNVPGTRYRMPVDPVLTLRARAAWLPRYCTRWR